MLLLHSFQHATEKYKKMYRKERRETQRAQKSSSRHAPPDVQSSYTEAVISQKNPANTGFIL
jgi:hypothetical protein